MDFDADTVIYGCSHYPFLEPVFKKITSRYLNFIDPAISQLTLVDTVFKNENLAADKRKRGATEFWISGNNIIFESFLNRHFKNIEYSINSYQLTTN